MPDSGKAADHDLAETVTRYRQVLANQPDRTDLLFLLAVALLQGPDPADGEEPLLRYISRVPGDAAAWHVLGKIKQAKADDDGARECFEKAIALNPNDSPSWNDLGASLHQGGHLLDAAGAFARASAIDPTWALPCYNLGNAHFDMEQLDLAEAAFRNCIRLDANLYDAYSMLASTLDHQHRPAEADVYADEYARRMPITVRASRGPRPLARVLVIMAAGMCNTRTDYLFSLSRYETVTVYVRADKHKEYLAALWTMLPTFDFVFSAVADADRAAPFLTPARLLCRELDLPTLNFPDVRIERTRRDLLPALLAGIPGATTPDVRRVDADELAHMANGNARVELPLVLRPCGFHGGRHFAKIDHAEDLAAYLSKTPHPTYYISRYHGYQSTDGNFRKYRFIFVDRKVYPYHLAIADTWKVHYFRADMAKHAWMRAEEEAFLADYRQIFIGALSDTVEAIARTLDLDYAGMDCAIAPDGRLLVFEANAAMLVHLNDPPDIYPYKHRYVPRIAQAIDDMVRRRLAKL